MFTPTENPPLSNALDLYRDDDRPRVEAAIERALNAGEPFDLGVRLDQVRDEPRWLRLQGSKSLVSKASSSVV